MDVTIVRSCYAVLLRPQHCYQLQQEKPYSGTFKLWNLNSMVTIVTHLQGLPMALVFLTLLVSDLNVILVMLAIAH